MDGMTAPFIRRVFYIPGYDPFPARRYRELYRTEGAAQAALSGYALRVERHGEGWRVTSRIEGQDTVADLAVLGWSDIVQASMDRGVAATYGQMVRTFWIYLSTGALGRLMRLRAGPVLAGFYPVAMLLVQLALAALAAAVAALLALVALPGVAGLGGAVLAGAMALVVVLRLFRRVDREVFAHYLMHDLAFTARDRGAYAPALEARIADWRARVADALTRDVDEVLVVGHSSGAHLAVSAVADTIRAGGVPEGRTLSLLTIGQAIPMVSFLPRAHRLRADLALLAASDRVVWVDVSAPGDGCCFALCDPVAVSGVAPSAKRWPLVISAAFTHNLSAQTRAALRWRYFRLHFQYLCAFDALPGTAQDYDYFRITAGPRRLADHFAGRGPSPARIERAINRHTGVAP
jgi:hypothetical protein